MSREEEEFDRLYLTFSAEEIARIVVWIIKGVEPNEAIPAIPRYTWEQHAAYIAFYEQLKESIDIVWQEE